MSRLFLRLKNPQMKTKLAGSGIKGCAIDCWKTGSRRIRTDIGEFSLVNRTIADWDRLPEGAIGTPLVKTHVLRKRVRKVYQ
jgi:hypothetical protein